MKKKFNSLFVILLAMAMIFAFGSCSDDGDEDSVKTYTVSYETRLGTVPDSITVKEGTVLSQTHLPSLNQSEYTFEGWYEKDTDIKAEVGVYTVKNDVVLQASWTYTITLGVNGGSGRQTESVKVPVHRSTYVSDRNTSDDIVTLPTPEEVGMTAPTGKKFVCWNTEPDGSGLSVRAGEDDVYTECLFNNHYTLGNSAYTEQVRTLHAIWRESSAKIATQRTAEAVLAELKNGDTLIFIGNAPNNSWTYSDKELNSKYLNDENKKIILDLSYHAGYLGHENIGVGLDYRYFVNCDSIVKVIIGKRVAGNASYCFEGCSNLTTVEFSGSETKIPARAFSGCALSSVTLPDTVRTINEYAFQSNKQLVSITIPANVTQIEKFAFLYCTALTSVTFTNTEGWKVRKNSEDKSPIAISVTDSATNATNLLSGGDWWGKQLIRK